jgi:hypothetical protein
MKIENILTKRSRLDRRYRLTQDLRRWFNRYTRASALYGLIIGALLGCFIADNPKSELSRPLSQTIDVKPIKVEAKEDKYQARGYAYCYDPLICIRDVGEELGVPNKDIMTMIRIARAESGLRPDAKNPMSTATGVFQIIIGTWDGNKCEGERWDYIDNIKCGYRLYQRRGFQPWNASKHVWSKI